MSSISAEKKKGFAGTILTVLITLMLPIVLIVLLFLTVPKARHGVFLFALELPGYVTNFMLEQYVPIRRFDKAVPWLERELRLVNWFAPPRNRLLPGLIHNTGYAMERARFPQELALLRPYLVKLVDSHPNLYPARIWLARALADEDPSAMFEQLESATKLSSADPLPFRIAINLSVKNHLPEKLNEWCERYKKSQFGGLYPLKDGAFYYGIGLRELALEAIDTSGERWVAGSMGLQLGKNITYDFPFEKSISIKELNLHLGIVRGISVTLKQIQTYRNGQRRIIFEKGLVLTSWSGFHLENQRFLTVSNHGEIIFIHPPEGGFGEADRIELILSFERLGIANPPLCGEKKIS
jgi:hypothetical protein